MWREQVSKTVREADRGESRGGREVGQTSSEQTADEWVDDVTGRLDVKIGEF